MRKILLLLAVATILTSCDERRKDRDRYAQVAERLEQKLDSTNAIISQQQTEQEELARKLEESKQREEAEAAAARQREELKQKAENEPIVISNLKVSNVTKHGTLISDEGPFKKWDIEYIKWSCDYEDFVVRTGAKSYGDLYVKYMSKDDSDGSWSVYASQGYFYTRNGRLNAYTQKLSMTDDGSIYGSWSDGLGMQGGGGFDRGQWKIELYWDKDHDDKAIYLGGVNFEVY